MSENLVISVIEFNIIHNRHLKCPFSINRLIKLYKRAKYIGDNAPNAEWLCGARFGGDETDWTYCNVCRIHHMPLKAPSKL